MFRDFVKGKIDVVSFREKWFFSYQLYVHLKSNVFLGVFRYFIIYLYSWYVSYQLFGVTILPKVFFLKRRFKVVIEKSKTSKVISTQRMPIIFESFNFGNSPVFIGIKENSTFRVDNQFIIGNGCIISLLDSSYLHIEGSSLSQVSGVTCDSKIICASKISIGEGTIISWGCYICDTSHHKIDGVLHISPIEIGKHVWISEGVSIASGSVIGADSIIGSKSYVKGNFVNNSLIAGVPAVVKKINVTWER